MKFNNCLIIASLRRGCHWNEILMKILCHSCHQAIKLNNAAIASVSTGHIINLVSVDSQKFDFVSLQMVNSFILSIFTLLIAAKKGWVFQKVIPKLDQVASFSHKNINFKIS